MFGGKEVSDGAVTRGPLTAAFFLEVRIGRQCGRPVFSQSGALAGIGAIDDKRDVRRWNEAVDPRRTRLRLIATALQKTTGVTPPPATRLLLSQLRRRGPHHRRGAAKAPRATAPKISAAILTSRS